jgi:uncharacterized phage-associated protein
MASVFDTAQYILQTHGPMTTWQLQKLCYYAQAWSLVWDDAPLFREPIEAWANGPVVPDLYSCHRGEYSVSELPKGNPSKLTKDQKETIDAIIKYYGKLDSDTLRRITHKESPWRNARKREGLSLGERGNAVITLDDMCEYYGGLCEEEADK